MQQQALNISRIIEETALLLGDLIHATTVAPATSEEMHVMDSDSESDEEEEEEVEVEEEDTKKNSVEEDTKKNDLEEKEAKENEKKFKSVLKRDEKKERRKKRQKKRREADRNLLTVLPETMVFVTRDLMKPHVHSILRAILPHLIPGLQYNHRTSNNNQPNNERKYVFYYFFVLTIF